MGHCLSWVGRCIAVDVRARWRWYAHDWRQGWCCGFRILAPSTYIFLASVLPALAFGQQLAEETSGQLTVVHVLVACGMSGLVQAIVGGQPLLIVGVSEPIVLIYSFMFKFAQQNTTELPPDMFLPWAAWVCTWASAFLLLLALTGSCSLVDRFTRMSGELFGLLIALLFAQQAIKGTIDQFRPPHHAAHAAHADQPSSASLPVLMLNGMTAILLACGFFITSVATLSSHSSLYLRGWMRLAMSSYGVPLMVVMWTAISFAVTGVTGVPRRVSTVNTWEVQGSWSMPTRMLQVPPKYIGAAVLPAFTIAVLFFFDHTVSSQLAQQKEFNLCKPPAYHYDMLLLGCLTLWLGLLGVPPVNGVLPQAPMHTRSLAKLGNELHRARQQQQQQQQQQADVAMLQATSGPAGAPGGGIDGAAKGSTHDGLRGEVVEMQVVETRLSGLLQSMLVCLCLGLTPAIKLIPVGVIWGYFAFMGFTSLAGNQLWQRLLLLVMDPQVRPRVLLQPHLAFVRLVPFPVAAGFTLFQLAYLLGIWALITFSGIGGVAFPLPIMALVPIRMFVLPHVFPEAYLQQLDAEEYLEEEPLTKEAVMQEAPHAEGLQPAAELDLEFAGVQVKHHLTHEQLQQRVEMAAMHAPGSPRPCPPASPLSGGTAHPPTHTHRSSGSLMHSQQQQLAAAAGHSTWGSNSAGAAGAEVHLGGSGGPTNEIQPTER